MGNKRKTIEVKVDNKGRILQTGECQLSTGEYTYRITDDNGKRQLIAIAVFKNNDKVCTS